MSRILIAALAALALISCGRKSEEPPASFTPEKVAGKQGGPRDKVGRIYHYVRSNVDGSNPEDVYVFRKRLDQIQIYRSRQKCAEPGLDTADLDIQSGYATKIVRARLNKKGVTEPFAFLDYSPADRQLKARIEIEGAPPVTGAAGIEKEPWHLYDLDLATLTVTAPHLQDPRAGFSFGLPLMIADPTRADFILSLGEAEATFREEETRAGFPALRFQLGGAAFGSYGGQLWLDAKDGHIVDVETGFPNRTDYVDFKLELRDVADGGDPAWAKLLREHFEGCN